LINLERPEFSRVLRAPLPAGAEGYGLGLCRDRPVDPTRQRLRQLVDGYAHAVKPVESFTRRTFPRPDSARSAAISFFSNRDEAYQSLLAIIGEGRRLALAEARVDMPGARIIPGASRQPFKTVLPERLPALRAAVAADGVLLSWDRRADLAGLTFELHRGEKPDFIPDDASRLAALTRSDYLDPIARCGTWHYALVCVADDQRSPPVRATATVNPGADFPDIISEDLRRFTALLANAVPERRVEGLQGLAHAKYWPAEDAVLPLLDERSPEVRRAAVMALGRLGGARSVPRFIALLDDPSWELRQHAWLSLRAMTAQDFGAAEPGAWSKWWIASTITDKEEALLRQARQPAHTVGGKGTNVAARAAFVPTAPGRRARQREGVSPPAHPERRAALRALARLATPAGEESLLQFLQQRQAPPLDPDERRFICEALERVGSSRAIPMLAAQRSDAAAWALGHVGGAEAERALLDFPKTLPVCLALDRLHSTNAGPFLVHLVGQMGQITYRGQPDDVMNEDLQPIQRVSANLIRRSGLAETLIECVLQELEETMKPPITHGPRPPHPSGWDEMLARMRSELKPGFVREDGTTTSQPVVAMCYLLGGDGAASREPAPAVVPRLVALLRHPASVPRVYVALALGGCRRTRRRR
jgi:HEAT repeat protein